MVIEWHTTTKTISLIEVAVSLIKVAVSLVEVTVSLVEVVATLVEVVATLVEAADSLVEVVGSLIEVIGSLIEVVAPLIEVVATLVCTKDVLQKIVSCFPSSSISTTISLAWQEICLLGFCRFRGKCLDINVTAVIQVRYTSLGGA